MLRLWQWLGENTHQLAALASVATALLFVIGLTALLLQWREIRNLQARYEHENLVDLVFAVDNIGSEQHLLWANTGKVPIFIQGWRLEVPANPQAQPNLSEAIYKGLNLGESDSVNITQDVHRLLSQSLGVALTTDNKLSQPVEAEFAVHVRYFGRGQRHERRVRYRFSWRPPNKGRAEQIEPADDRTVPSVH